LFFIASNYHNQQSEAPEAESSEELKNNEERYYESAQEIRAAILAEYLNLFDKKVIKYRSQFLAVEKELKLEHSTVSLFGIES
jgi:hypothetical protein